MKIVLKIGTGVLTKEGGSSLDDSQFDKITRAIATAKSEGHSIILVTSGAVSGGLSIFEHQKRPAKTAELQACAAIGQTHLMHLYETHFRKHGLHVAQVLLTLQDMQDPARQKNIKNTLSRLLSHSGIIPIVNENDSVAIEELKYGDNDILSSQLALLCRAERYIIFTSVDGLYPEGVTHVSENIIPEVKSIQDILHHANSEIGVGSVGGMKSKLRAIECVLKQGIPATIANGRKPEQLLKLIEGKGHATYFHPESEE